MSTSHGGGERQRERIPIVRGVQPTPLHPLLGLQDEAVVRVVLVVRARHVLLQPGVVVDTSVVELLAAPHRRPSSMPPGTQAVYAFILGEHCLKVGKAGPKTQARFTSQHYGKNAPSTLAKSILKHRVQVESLLPRRRSQELDDLDHNSIGTWIETNTSRLHVFIPASLGGLALGLVEGFVQCRLDPVFEGRGA